MLFLGGFLFRRTRVFVFVSISILPNKGVERTPVATNTLMIHVQQFQYMI